MICSRLYSITGLCSTPVSVPNGEILSSAIWFTEGDVIKYKCNNGYQLSGSNASTCMTNGWSDTIPTCINTTISMANLHEGNSQKKNTLDSCDELPSNICFLVHEGICALRSIPGALSPVPLDTITTEASFERPRRKLDLRACE